MLKRYLLTMFLALAGSMVAISPVAAMAMAGDMLCEQRAALQDKQDRQPLVATHADHMKADVESTSHAGHAKQDRTSDTQALVCCDHACLFEASTPSFDLVTAGSSSRAIHAWASDDLTELNHPNGLRRPPKA
ncbi:hypothetical protein [Pseudooceanicola spongiae]|uniref:Secreted protein n=1 Tax=Pseudooceanicola spongiae TaxID=2613965 RepID=A0A7L9WSE7_9RHOB|nr:hypothetical protein [Pseudooceanicola spongiae]QOL82812.1 hypothetical protein F3W81_19465 [Pseudooceanicola spongiae]